jgi:hypothetical protein
MARTMRQLELPVRTWGGRRDGAGRKPAPGRRAVPHRPRVEHDRHCPVHVTLRATAGVPSLRHGRLFIATRTALAAASTERFRVLHFSVQADHLHLLVEADEPTGFERGVRGLVIRVAKAVNRALGRRGRIWGDRVCSGFSVKGTRLRAPLGGGCTGQRERAAVSQSSIRARGALNNAPQRWDHDGKPSTRLRYRVIPSLALTAGTDFTITQVDDQPSIPGAGHRETSVTIPLSGLVEDTWIVVLVRGTPGVSRPLFPILPGLSPAGNTTLADLVDGNLGEGGETVLAFSNPLYVDVDGNPWTAPGVRLTPP